MSRMKEIRQATKARQGKLKRKDINSLVYKTSTEIVDGRRYRVKYLKPQNINWGMWYYNSRGKKKYLRGFSNGK